MHTRRNVNRCRRIAVRASEQVQGYRTCGEGGLTGTVGASRGVDVNAEDAPASPDIKPSLGSRTLDQNDVCSWLQHQNLNKTKTKIHLTWNLVTHFHMSNLTHVFSVI